MGQSSPGVSRCSWPTTLGDLSWRVAAPPQGTGGWGKRVIATRNRTPNNAWPVHPSAPFVMGRARQEKTRWHCPWM